MPNTKKMLKQKRLTKSIRVKNKILKGGSGFSGSTKGRPIPRVRGTPRASTTPTGKQNAFTPSSTPESSPSSSISSITSGSRTGTIGSESNASFASQSIEGGITPSSSFNNGPPRMFGERGKPEFEPTPSSSNAPEPAIIQTSTEPIKQLEGNVTQPSVNATKPTVNATKPEEPIKTEGNETQLIVATQSAVNVTQPSVNATKPEESIKPAVNVKQSVVNVKQSDVNATQPAIIATKPAVNVTKPNIEQLKKVMNEFATITEDLSKKIKTASSKLTGNTSNPVSSKVVGSNPVTKGFFGTGKPKVVGSK